MELRKRTLEEELEALYGRVPPPPGGLVEGRRRMFAEAAQRGFPPLPAKENRVPLLRRLRLAPAFRAFAICAVVIFALAFAGGGVVLASGGSLPGEMLYPIKLAVEDFRLSLTSDPVTQAERSMSFVSERVEEMRGLADKGEAIPDGVVTRMEQQIDQVVTQTAAASPDEGPGLVERLRDGMRQQQQVLEQIQATGSPGDQSALNTALRLTVRAYQAADLAKGDPKRMQYEYLHQARPEEPGAEAPQSEYNHENQNQNQSGGEAVDPPVSSPAGDSPGPGTGTGTGTGTGSGPGTGSETGSGSDSDSDPQSDSEPDSGGSGPGPTPSGSDSGTSAPPRSSFRGNLEAGPSEKPPSGTKETDQAATRRRNQAAN